MAPRVVVLLALLGVVIAAPQLYLSEKSHLGLEQALGGRVPVGVYSANKIYKGYEGEGSDVIVLNIPGLSHPVGREDFLLDSHESNELLPSIGGVPLPAVVRRKRSFGSSDDDEDDPFSTTRAEDGAFALSSLGILLVQAP